MSEEDWQVGYAKSLGVFLHGAAIQRPGEHGERVRDDSFYVVFNALHEKLPFTLPSRQFGGRWTRVLDTSSGVPPELRRRGQSSAAGSQVEAQPRSVVVFRSPLAEE
jgi:glycogen operon protein